MNKAQRLLTPKKQRKEFRVAAHEAVKDKTVLLLSEHNKKLARRGLLWVALAVAEAGVIAWQAAKAKGWV